MINCPKCGGRSQVTDSRHKPDGIRRRRSCKACGNRWTTMEVDHRFYRLAISELGLKPDSGREGSIPKNLRAHIDRQRGFSVPGHLEDDYRTFRRNGFSAKQAARKLGLLK